MRASMYSKSGKFAVWASARVVTREVGRKGAGEGEEGESEVEEEGCGVCAHARPRMTVSDVVWRGEGEGEIEGSWRACDSWRCVVVRWEVVVWGMAGNKVIWVKSGL